MTVVLTPWVKGCRSVRVHRESFSNRWVLHAHASEGDEKSLIILLGDRIFTKFENSLFYSVSVARKMYSSGTKWPLASAHSSILIL